MTDSPAKRPLQAMSRAQLMSRLQQAYRDADGASGAHCIHELWMRGEMSFTIEAALERLWGLAAASVPEWLPMRYVDWLPQAYEVALTFKAASKGRTHIYLVLLDFADRRASYGHDHGVYVGKSRYGPAQRFDQHKAGIRAAGSVLKRGIEVLTGPTLHLQFINSREAVRIEAQLAEALKAAGLLVKGGH